MVRYNLKELQKPYLVTVSDEELSALICDIFRWLEKESPELVFYNDFSFASAMERFFYFTAAQQPVLLFPLLKAATEWRHKTTPSPLTALYDELLVASNRTKKLARSLFYVKRISRLGKHLAKLLFYQDGRTQPPENNLSRIGFFAINSRFVQFFKEYANALGKEKVIFFCVTSEASATAKSLGFTVAINNQPALNIKNAGISVMHPLFDAYWAALALYQRIYSMLALYQPATLIFAEGTSMQDQLAGLSAKRLGISTVRIQSGRAGVLHVGYQCMAFDKMLCWGKGFVERYRQYTPNAEYVITGSPLVAKSTSCLPLNANCITCVIFTQPISKYITKLHYEALANLALRLIGRYDGMRILIRKHPVDTCSDLDALAVQHPDKVTMAGYQTWTLQKVMESADIAIGFYSTTLSESAACGVIPLILKFDNFAHSVFPFPEQYGAAVEAQSVDAAMRQVEVLLDDPGQQARVRENMSRFSSEFFGPCDGKGIERTVNCILQAAGV